MSNLPSFRWVTLLLVRGTQLKTKHRRGEGARESGEGGAEKGRDGRFFSGLYILLTHLSRRVVHEEIRKDQG